MHAESLEPNSKEFRGVSADAPPGFTVTVRSRGIGEGEECFRVARRLLFSWQVQLGSGFRPIEVPPEVRVGASSVFTIPFGPLAPQVACRVFEVIDEPRRAEFSHVALEGHPQAGWESFGVMHEPDGRVRLTVRVVWRPAVWWMKAPGPLTGEALALVLRRNLRSLDVGLRAARSS
ncbi:uncharacterized protein (UPF0548 family) [Compostimonas suwonensis]|uniref:Uncharacterized protein (UPF0548 family) n=1 Tax=Compostimonas suwonensis TaxID=1048394 RepID=A0A2M9BW66_9MICO|nr:uncharacterized protein (UPF0548 family) [Compostimonas suwonensis]